MIFTFVIINLISLVYLKNLVSEKETRNLLDLDLETIRNNMLDTHNYYRKKHQADNLKRNSEIEAIAQEYSKYQSSISTMVHSGNTYKGQSLGENLYSSWGSYQVTVDGKEAVESWYSEIKDYDFDNPGFTKGVGHFTQLIWKGSKELGCGAVCEKNACYVTCNYYPAGNVLNDFANNVLPEGGMSTAAKVFLSIFIILIILIAAFAVYHFVYKKRSLNEIKDYFKCKSKK